MLVPPNASSGGGSSPIGIVQQSRRHRRLSSLNTVSWPAPVNELTVSPRTRRMSTVAGSDAGVQEDDVNLLTRVVFKIIFSMTLPMQENDDKSFASPRNKSPRRKSSYSTSIAPDDITLDPTSRRRSSYIPSWAIDDDEEEGLTTTRAGRRRQYSWGPAGELGFRDSIRSASSRSPVSHHECKLDFDSAHETLRFLNRALFSRLTRV